MASSPVNDPFHPAKPGVDKSAAEWSIVQIQLNLETLRNQRKVLEYHPSTSLVIFRWLRTIFILLGSIFVLVGIVIFRSIAGFITLLFGIAMFIILYFIATAYKRKTVEDRQRWDETSGKTIQSLDEEIAQKIIELDAFQGIVASK